MRMNRCIILASLGLAFAVRAFAFMGVGDQSFVTVTSDLTEPAKWAKELEQWTRSIKQITEQVNKTDRLIKIAGDPQRLAGELSSMIGAESTSGDPTGGSATFSATMDLARASYGLANASRRTINDANRVDTNYTVFGESYKRDPKGYTHYAMQQALYDRYTAAVENQRKVNAEELAFQQKIMKQLTDPNVDQTARMTAQAALEASKARQDMAVRSAKTAKDEYDMFTGRIKAEDDMKAAADAESLQTMLNRLKSSAAQGDAAQTNLNTL